MTGDFSYAHGNPLYIELFIAIIVLCQLDSRSGLAVVPTHWVRYVTYPSSVAAANPDLTLELHCVLMNQAAEPKLESSSAIGSITPIAAAYCLLKEGDCMFRVPWPGIPGKWFLLYLKLPLSNSMMAIAAACSPTDLMPHLSKDLLIEGAVVAASAHSSGKSAPTQLAVAGAILIRISAEMVPIAGPLGFGVPPDSEFSKDAGALNVTVAASIFVDRVGESACSKAVGIDVSRLCQLAATVVRTLVITTDVWKRIFMLERMRSNERLKSLQKRRRMSTATIMT